MIAVDTNVLVYAHRQELTAHSSAQRRLTELAQGAARWGLPVFCLAEFLRVVTHRRLFDPPTAIEKACAALDAVLASPSVELLLPGQRYWRLLCEAMVEGDAGGNLAFDAQIVALCREKGVRTLLTADRDFDRFTDFPTQAI